MLFQVCTRRTTGTAANSLAPGSYRHRFNAPVVTCRTYISVLCGTCGTAVGRCYEAMEEGLQHLQSRFLLDAASIRRFAGRIFGWLPFSTRAVMSSALALSRRLVTATGASACVYRWQLGSCKQRAPAEVGAANVEAAPLVQQQQQRIEQLEDELLKASDAGLAAAPWACQSS